MLEKPIFNKLSDRFYDMALLTLVTIMYIALCAESDMYVPAFPQMIKYFGVEENKIQLILSINFGGLCISGLVTGPLSDCYGRRKILLGGVLLFVISSIGCVFAENFKVMLCWRLLQGIAASVPMVIGAAAFFDKYSSKKAAQISGILNSVISAAMAAAPIAGAWISQIFDWRANFVVILVLAVISFVGSLLFIEETLLSNKRKKLDLKSISRDYIKLSKSLKFIGYTIIVMFPFTAILVYVANLSVIFINHMNMDLVTFSYYQASTMVTFIIFSLLSIKLIGSKGIDYTKNLGGIVAAIGAILIFYVSQVDKENVNFICIAMAFIAAGGAMMGGTFGAKAMAVFPGMNGIAMALMTAIRQLLAFGLVILSEVFFDGTIVPVAIIIICYAVVSVICYIVVCYSDTSKVTIEEKTKAGLNLHQ